MDPRAAVLAARAAYRETVRDPGFESRYLASLAFFVTFLLIRGGTWWAVISQNDSHLELDGIHIHHMVLGLIVTLAASILALDGWRSAMGGLAMGIGTALILDEFSLILYVEDTYWQKWGVLASSIAVVVAGLILFANVWVGRRLYGRALLRIAAITGYRRGD
jgi:hypothetical protein